MSRQLGKWFRICPVCHEEYVLTNWMRRWVDVDHVTGVRVRTDTHVIACKRRAAEQDDA